MPHYSALLLVCARGACGASDHIDYFIHHPECAVYGITSLTAFFSKRPFRQLAEAARIDELFPRRRPLADHGSHGFCLEFITVTIF